jgi:hypothetical protein
MQDRARTCGEALIGAIMTGALGLLLMSALAEAAEPLTIKIGYVGRAPERKVPISLLDYPADNNGIAGARLALEDNNTTGRFLNQRFSLDEVRLKGEADPADAVAQLADRGISFVVLDLPADLLLKASEAGRARGLVFFNAGALDDRLREEDCRANVIHTAPNARCLPTASPSISSSSDGRDGCW